MVDPSKLHHSPDHPQEVLRRALKEAKLKVGTGGILKMIPAKNKHKMTYKTVDNFISNITKELSHENFEILNDAWIKSPLGRYLRYSDGRSGESFEALVNSIATGRIRCPARWNFVGNYFLYYMSYVEDGCSAIRVIEIYSGDDHLISVRDSIRDILKGDGKILVSNGSLTFLNEFCQFLLMPNENNDRKAGLTFMCGALPAVDGEGRVESMRGTFLTMTKFSRSAFRYWLLVREPDGDASKMIEESGAYTKRQLNEPRMARHRKAFKLLKAKPPEVSNDPIANVEALKEIPKELLSDKAKKHAISIMGW